MASLTAVARNSQAMYPACRSMNINPFRASHNPAPFNGSIPTRFVSTVDPSTGSMPQHGDTPQNCQFGNLGRNALRGPNFAWSDFYLTKWFPLTEQCEVAFRRTVLQCIQSSEFRTPEHGAGWHSGKAFYSDRIWSAYLHDLSADRITRRRFGRRQHASHDRVSTAPAVLSAISTKKMESEEPKGLESLDAR